MKNISFCILNWILECKTRKTFLTYTAVFIVLFVKEKKLSKYNNPHLDLHFSFFSLYNMIFDFIWIYIQLNYSFIILVVIPKIIKHHLILRTLMDCFWDPKTQGLYHLLGFPNSQDIFAPVSMFSRKMGNRFHWKVFSFK